MNQNETSKIYEPAVLLESVSENRGEWKRVREGRLGASDIATICGLNVFMSALTLWAIWTKKIAQERTETVFTRFGILMEPVIAQLFQDAHPEMVVTPNDTTFCYKHDERFIATPDARLMHDEKEFYGVLEIKATQRAKGWEDGAIPDQYHCQLMWQMGVMGADWGYITALLRGNPADMKEVYCEFEPEIFEQMIEQAHRFLECVEKDIPPNAGPGDSKLLDEIVERDPESEIVLDADAYEWYEQLKEAKHTKRDLGQELKHWDDKIKTCQNNIRRLMGGASLAHLPNGAQIKLTNVDVKERTQKGYSYTRFSLKEPKENNG